MRVPSLGREDPLEEDMATHSSVPAWRIPWTEAGGLQRAGHDWSDSAQHPGGPSSPRVGHPFAVWRPLVYNPRSQTDIISSLCAKMHLWFNFNFYNAVCFTWWVIRLLRRGEKAGSSWPGPQGLKRFQDSLPFLSKVSLDLLYPQAGWESR